MFFLIIIIENKGLLLSPAIKWMFIRLFFLAWPVCMILYTFDILVFTAACRKATFETPALQKKVFFFPKFWMKQGIFGVHFTKKIYIYIFSVCYKVAKVYYKSKNRF